MSNSVNLQKTEGVPENETQNQHTLLVVGGACRTVDVPNMRARIKVPPQTVRKSGQNKIMCSRTRPRMNVPSPAIPPNSMNAARRIWVFEYDCLNSPMYLILDLD